MSPSSSALRRATLFTDATACSVKAGGSRWLLPFDDWMFLQDGAHRFNKTEMKKSGATVATLTLFFTRTAQ